MRNYVIINGVNSLTIQGLAINILPTITKAPMRTMREEIDGRDGDITTNLGYGAYDKSLEIGLFGNYNVDDVIAFFNTKGQIIFSDENDKVYNFEIVDQIDFAKLIKFRTATINIHCQPFKYPLNEEPIEKEYEFINGTGTSISLNDTANAKFGEFVLKGNASQNGTPTSSSPIRVDAVSGTNIVVVYDENDVQSQGFTIELPVENMFDETTIELGKVIASDGAINDAVGYCAGDYMPCLPNTQYTISFVLDTSTGGENLMRVAFYDANKTFLSRPNSANNPYVITTPNNCYYMRLSYAVVSHNQVQIEIGSKANKYQAYGNEAIELYKIGTAQDYIHKINGGWVVHREIGHFVFNGNETIDSINTSNGIEFRYYNETIKQNTAASNVPNVLSNMLGAKNVNDLWNTSVNGISIANTSRRLLFKLTDTSINSVDLFKSWLASNNLEVYYELHTPIEEAIEDANLITQLNKIEKAKSYEDVTNISQTNNDLPFILDVSAIKKGSDQAVIVNGGNIYSKPTINMVGNGVVSLYLEGVQMFQVDLSKTHEITIDTDKMEAINPNTLELANRLVVGDYSKFKLESGSNNLSVDGNITSATFTKYTRWL